VENKKKKKQYVSDDKKPRYKSLIIDGSKYRTFYNHKFDKRNKFKLHDPNMMVSYIPGTVIRVLAKEGQEVHTGDTALILDAMKMKNRLIFEKDGIVKAIHVSEGERIPKDTLMIELENVPGQN
jgi:biotin carboxyl carrier protein